MFVKTFVCREATATGAITADKSQVEGAEILAYS